MTHTKTEKAKSFTESHESHLINTGRRLGINTLRDNYCVGKHRTKTSTELHIQNTSEPLGSSEVYVTLKKE